MSQVASEHLGESLGTDFFSVREQFTDEQWEHFITVRRFVDEEVVPVVGPYWERAEICWPLVRRLPELGIVGEDIKGYGCAEMSPMACGLVTMELHRGDGSLGVFLGVHAGLAMLSIAMCGSEEQKARWLPDMAQMNKLGAFALTEPEHGSDSVALETSARPVKGDGEAGGDGYRVTGRKVWTSKALESERVLLLTRTTPIEECAKRTDGLTLFVAPLKDPAVTIRPIPKLGRNAVASCEVTYDGLYVDARDRVGEEGRGFGYLLDGLNAERVLVAAEALGTGRAALRRAVAYAKARVVFGRPIGQNQGISFPLAEAHARLGAAELAIRQASWRIDQGLSAGEQANLAKFLAAEAGFQAADAALQTHGGFGYANEYHVERYWREARLMRIAPVPQEMVLNYLAEHVLGLPRSY